MTYARDCWYMFGWADELALGEVLARTICATPIVLFRSENGAVAALQDRCPHRFAPLSLGAVQGDSIACGYHGLAFNGAGACTLNPHGPVTTKMRVPTYPVIEAYAALWIWLGDPDIADPALLPDFSFIEDTRLGGTTKGYVRGEADYRLYIDNIMDLSHIDFLHASTIGGGSITGTRQKVSESERELSVRWTRADVPATASQAEFGDFQAGDLLNRFTEVTWAPPGNMRLTSAFGPRNSHEDTFKRSIAAHVMTPESGQTTHYFFLLKHDLKLGDPAFDERLGSMLAHIFTAEDSPMLAAIQQRMGENDLMGLSPLILKSDEAAIRVRRKLETMILGEQK